MAVAIHSTALGPALGGLRLWAYSTLDAAVGDALRLSQAMTFKAAAAGLDLGGGKATLLDDGLWGERRDERMRVVGDLVESLGGRYVTGPDIGTTMADMDAIAARTRHVIGKSQACGGADDPSPVTARGVADALRAALGARTGSDALAGRRSGVVGAGKDGASLAAQLAAAGAEVLVSDVDPDRVARCERETGAHGRTTDALLRERLDGLAPCALGELIDEAVARDLRCLVVAGGANNPLAGDGVADVLAAREILYVPDFIANCGGLIHVESERTGFDHADVERRLADAHARLTALLEESARDGESPLRLASRRAGERVAAAGR
jgi:leucine dehydrogenase